MPIASVLTSFIRFGSVVGAVAILTACAAGPEPDVDEAFTYDEQAHVGDHGGQPSLTECITKVEVMNGIGQACATKDGQLIVVLPDGFLIKTPSPLPRDQDPQFGKPKTPTNGTTETSTITPSAACVDASTPYR